MTSSPVEKLAERLHAIVLELSGVEFAPDLRNESFLDLGFDSLFLTQLSNRLNKELHVKLRFRQLTDEFPSIAALAQHLATVVPSEPRDVSTREVARISVPGSTGPTVPAVVAAQSADRGALERVFAQQLQIMERQLQMLAGWPGPEQATSSPSAPTPRAERPIASHVATSPGPAVVQPSASDPSSALVPSAPAFGAQVRIERRDAAELTPRQQRHLALLIERYSDKTRDSKAYTQQHRARLADPRAVSGFHPKLKEMVYPLVATRSAGSRLWDIDGNEYVDLLNGYGSCFFGHAAPFVVQALRAQLDDGFEIGPQHHLAGVVAEKFCAMVGHDRAAFCNTGSEAVLGAIRMARTLTGKSKVVMFQGAYHGINDEVIVRGSASGVGLPAAAGIPASHTANIVLLEYGDHAALERIRAEADQLAAVIVEPVQSRKPELQPREFLHALRSLTRAEGIALIVDEVVCGFRVAQGGAQEWFGVRADIATYGKVVGGGLPIGVIAGSREYMDTLDGGTWQYGDESVPEVGVTYFAGTFVRHPLVLAAANASLDFMKQHGPALQHTVNQRTTQLAHDMNVFAESAGVPVSFGHFASMMKPHWSVEQTLGDLLFAHMRLRGVHVYDGRPCFLTVAHDDDDCAVVLDAFRESIHELQRGGFFVRTDKQASIDAMRPPVPGARLGRDQHGNPAWFAPDPQRPGKFQRVAAS